MSGDRLILGCPDVVVSPGAPSRLPRVNSVRCQRSLNRGPATRSVLPGQLPVRPVDTFDALTIASRRRRCPRCVGEPRAEGLVLCCSRSIDRLGEIRPTVAAAVQPLGKLPSTPWDTTNARCGQASTEGPRVPPTNRSSGLHIRACRFTPNGCLFAASGVASPFDLVHGVVGCRELAGIAPETACVCDADAGLTADRYVWRRY